MPQFLTTRQVADILAIHVNSVKRLTDAGRLPAPVKLSTAYNGRVRFPAAETIAAIEAMRCAPKAA